MRIQLHGGVSRETNGVRAATARSARWPAPSRFTSFPTAGHDAPWWAEQQVENLRTILDTVKRTYNVDENRVAVAGVSDGGTGALLHRDARHDPVRELPAAQWLHHGPALGRCRAICFPNNLRNKPFFVVNGGRDPLYPTRVVEPYVKHLKNQRRRRSNIIRSRTAFTTPPGGRTW